MPFAHPLPPDSAPDPESAPGMSDDAVVAALRMSRTIEGTTPVAALIARHGPAVSDYAEICAFGSPALSRAIASAAFRQVVRELQKAGSTSALRPRLLVTVREAARARSQTGPVPGVSYDQAGTTDSDRSPHPVAENRLLSRTAFFRLPRTTQYVLWHMEVEAEPSAVPAALLGIEGDLPPFELDRAREQWRSALLRTHVENSAGRECRDYSRLLDAPSRSAGSSNAGSTLPEVQMHLDQCAYCRHTAEQLRLCAGEPGVLLAEALLGESAHPYLTACRARPARTAPVATAAAGTDTSRSDNGRTTPRGSTRKRRPRAGRRGTKLVVAGIAVGSAAVGAVLIVTGTSSDEAAQPRGATSHAYAVLLGPRGLHRPPRLPGERQTAQRRRRPVHGRARIAARAGRGGHSVPLLDLQYTAVDLSRERAPAQPRRTGSVPRRRRGRRGAGP